MLCCASLGKSGHKQAAPGNPVHLELASLGKSERVQASWRHQEALLIEIAQVYANLGNLKQVQACKRHQEILPMWDRQV